MANRPPFATLNHFATDLGIPEVSDTPRVGISGLGPPAKWPLLGQPYNASPTSSQRGEASRESPVGRVERDVLRDLPLPAVAVREQAFLVVVELLACLGRELEVRSQNDGVDRAGLLAEAAVDAFHHVDVITGGPPRAVVAPRPRLDGDGLGRADRLAQLAGDAALLPVRIAPQRKLAAKAGRDRPLLERIVQRRLRLEEVAHRQHECRHELLQEHRTGRLIEPHGLILSGVAGLAERANVSRPAWFYDLSSSLNLRSATANRNEATRPTNAPT